MPFHHHPVFVVMSVAVSAPLLAELPKRTRIPVVVLEVLIGIAVGPHVLGLLELNDFLSVMERAGLAAVLFMAGMEIDFERIRGRPLGLALQGWCISVALGLVCVALLNLLPGMSAPLMVVLALTTTGLGALLPILRDGGELTSPYGRLLVAAGTVGELAPIVAVSLALSDRYSTWQELLFLVAFMGVVTAATVAGLRSRPPRLVALLGRTLHSSTQLPVRMGLLVLTAFVVFAEELGFERVLGAFAAGMVVGLATRGPDGEAFRTKMAAICFGWLSPFFFVCTGIGYDVGALTRDATTMLLVPGFLLILLFVRGAPVLLYRSELPRGERLPFALTSSVSSLGLVVVIAQIGLKAGLISQDVTQSLVGAALLSLVAFPMLAALVRVRERA